MEAARPHRCALVALCLSLHVHAGWWQRGEEGWFWYEDPPALVEEPEPPEPDPPPVAQASAEPQRAVAGPPPLSAAWLRDNLPVYLDLAVDDPSPANVRRYMLLQRVAMDKASVFSDMSTSVVTGDPVLDEYAAFPTGTNIASAMQRQAEVARDEMLRGLAQSVGVAFFFRSDCQYCELAVGVLRSLQQLYGFEILPISIDGKPLASGSLGQFRPDRGEAASLSITQTPALVLIRPPDGMEVVANGLVALTDLKDRILLTAAKRGWVDPAELRRTRPSVERTPDLARDPRLANIQQILEGETRAYQTP
jgi:conjugal transfer pilus assembly protein TraF